MKDKDDDLFKDSPLGALYIGLMCGFLIGMVVGAVKREELHREESKEV